MFKKRTKIRGFFVEEQIVVPLEYKGFHLNAELRIDLMINKLIIVELKAIENILPVHEAQLLTYMKLLQIPKGLLINFYTDNITKSMKPFVNEYFKRLKDA